MSTTIFHERDILRVCRKLPGRDLKCLFWVSSSLFWNATFQWVGLKLTFLQFSNPSAKCYLCKVKRVIRHISISSRWTLNSNFFKMFYVNTTRGKVLLIISAVDFLSHPCNIACWKHFFFAQQQSCRTNDESVVQPVREIARTCISASL